MASNGKSAVSKAQAEAHRRILSQLIRQDDNRRCADCLARGPTWASVNLGVFVCLNCSGVHRSLGTHTSKVRSTTLDTWLPEQVAFVQRMGNRRANLFWEGRLPKNFRRPAEGDMSGLSIFIGDKYREGLYTLRTWDKPPTIETYQVHPFMREVDGGEGEPSEVPAKDPVPLPKESASRQASQSNADVRLSTPIVSGGRAEGGPRGSATMRRIGPLAPPPSAIAKPATPPPKPSTPPPELFDLLSLDEPDTTTAPSPPPPSTPLDVFSSPAPVPIPAATADSDWAAFVSSSTAPAAPADEWDAFQGGDAAPSSKDNDPFASGGDPFGESGQTQSAFPSASAHFASAPASPVMQEPLKHHRGQKSAEEIMRIFDSLPQPGSGMPDLFATPSTAKLPQVNSSHQDNFFALPGTSGMSQPPAQPGFGLPPGYPGAMPWIDGAVPSFPMPAGVPSHSDLTFPPQMFQLPFGTAPLTQQLPAGFPGTPPLTANGWPSMPGISQHPSMGPLGGSRDML